MKNCISDHPKNVPKVIRSNTYGDAVLFFDFFGKSRVGYIYEEGGVPNRPENNIS